MSGEANKNTKTNNNGKKWYKVNRENKKRENSKGGRGNRRGGDRRGRGGNRRGRGNGDRRDGDRRGRDNNRGRRGNYRNRRSRDEERVQKPKEEVKEVEVEEPKWERKPSPVGSWAHIAGLPPKVKEDEPKEENSERPNDEGSEGSWF